LVFKTKANASNSHILGKEEIEKIRQMVEHGITVDEEEDKLYGDKRGDELPPELNTKKKLRDKIKEIEEASGKKMKNASKKIIEQYVLGDEDDKEKIMKKLDKAEGELTKSGQGAVSITDPESRFMENKKKRKELSYNPQIEMTEENIDGLPEWTKVSMDNDYFSGPNLRYLEEKGWMVIFRTASRLKR